MQQSISSVRKNPPHKGKAQVTLKTSTLLNNVCCKIAYSKISYFLYFFVSCEAILSNWVLSLDWDCAMVYVKKKRKLSEKAISTSYLSETTYLIC